MSREFTYFRKYIIFKNNYTNIEGIKPKGHGKIEIRGIKGTVSLNLDNCEPHGDYRAYFLRDMGVEIKEYDLGRLIIDERGRARTDIQFNTRDLESLGFPVDKIDAILIRKGKKILLNGYMDKDDGTVDRFMKQLISGDEESEERPVEFQEPMDFEPAQEIEDYKEVEDVEQDLGPEKVADIEDLEKEEFAKAEEEEVEVEEYSELEDLVDIEEFEIPEELEESQEAIEEIMEPEDIIEEVIQEEAQEVEEVEEDKVIEEIPVIDEETDYQSLEYMRQVNHKNQMTDYILSILRFFPHVDPFKIYLHGYSWWEIEDSNMELNKGFLPYYNYLMGTEFRYGITNNSTSCMDLINQYGHYIFGMYKEDKEVKYYIYGVPGRFLKDEHPFKGVTGFNTWYESDDGLGYWVLYIDPFTGKVIQIINPMFPEY